MPRPFALVVAALAVLLTGTAAFAQNDREAPSSGFVQETRSLQARWAGAVRNEQVDPEWIGRDRLVYRLDSGGGDWSFWQCDASSGEVAPAFDHARVAAALTRLLREEVGEGRIPLVRFAADGAGFFAMLSPEAAQQADTPVVRITDDAVALASAYPEAFAAERTTRGKSGSGPATYLLIRNTTDTPVRLFWLDGSGQGRAYEEVPAGATRVRTTFAGHVWSVRAGDEELARVVGEPRPTVLVLPLTQDEDARPRQEQNQQRQGPTVRVGTRDGNVFVRTQGEERQITSDGTPEHGFAGRVWVSPDGAHAVAMKIRRAPLRTVHLIESSPADQVQPKLHSFGYAKPGDPIDEPAPWVFDLETGKGTEMQRALIAAPWRLSEVHWVDNDRFRLLYNERGHAVVRLVEFDAKSGVGRTVVEEASDTFVDYPNKIRHQRLGDGRLLWMSQRTGFNHLYLLDGETGEVIRPLTSGEWLVRSIEQVDEGRGTVLLRVMGLHADQDPYHHHFVRVDMSTGEQTVLTDGDGTHAIERSPDDRFYTARYQRVDLPPVTELRRWRDGARVAVLAEADATALYDRGWRAPERFVAKGRDGRTDIWGVIFYPSDFDPAKKYAVIENIYAGPHGHFVPKDWRVWHGHRELAERGFIVVQIDGMGTNWRSKAFHDVAHRNLGDSGFPDRIAWLHAAAESRPFMDLARVGIYGGSAGGQSATRALLAHGDFYKAAVSDCGCHDNRVDKIWWNELWMGYPIGPHYAEQSNVTQAKNLTGDLLLIVGELDRNVDPASTMQVVDALIKADKDFELLVIPGAGHGAAGSPYGRRRQAEFFQRTLGPPAPADSDASDSAVIAR